MIRLITSVLRVPAAADAVQALQQLSLQKKTYTKEEANHLYIPPREPGSSSCE